MTKINFIKVEEALQAGIDKIQKKELLEKTFSEGEEMRPKEKKEEVLLFFKTWLPLLAKQDREIQEKLKIPGPLLKKIRGGEGELSEEEWNLLYLLKDEVVKIRKEVKKEKISDEELVKREAIRHQKKRLQVNEKWIPYD